MLETYFRYYTPVLGRPACALHDPLAAAIALGAVVPTLAPVVPMEVDTTGGPGRGQTLVDLRSRYIGYPPLPGARHRIVLDVPEGFGDDARGSAAAPLGRDGRRALARSTDVRDRSIGAPDRSAQTAVGCCSASSSELPGFSAANGSIRTSPHARQSRYRELSAFLTLNFPPQCGHGPEASVPIGSQCDHAGIMRPLGREDKPWNQGQGRRVRTR